MHHQTHAPRYAYVTPTYHAPFSDPITPYDSFSSLDFVCLGTDVEVTPSDVVSPREASPTLSLISLAALAPPMIVIDNERGS